MIIAGTGHRLGIKLGGYSDDIHNKLVTLAENFILENPKEITWLGKSGIDAVISGMALGWDQALAQAALNCKIPLYAYIPFKGQEGKWPQAAQDRYNRMLEQAARVVVCSAGGYSAEKMQIRNEMMVRDCTAVLSLWDGSSGGTGNCVAYANKIGKPIINLWDRWEK